MTFKGEYYETPVVLDIPAFGFGLVEAGGNGGIVRTGASVSKEEASVFTALSCHAEVPLQLLTKILLQPNLRRLFMKRKIFFNACK